MGLQLEITDEQIAENTDVIPGILINGGTHLLLLPRTKLSYPVQQVKFPERVFRQLSLSAKLSKNDSRILNNLVDHFIVYELFDNSSYEVLSIKVQVSSVRHKSKMYNRMFRIIEFTCDNNDEFTITFIVYYTYGDFSLYLNYCIYKCKYNFAIDNISDLSFISGYYVKSGHRNTYIVKYTDFNNPDYDLNNNEDMALAFRRLIKRAFTKK